MAEKMLQQSVISFTTLIFIIVLISIPVGILLFNFLSKAYLGFFKDLTDIASDRLKLDKKKFIDKEKIMVEEYISVLLDDQNKMKDLEKVNAWKDGAKLLIHEIKNPLTPLKLSAQSLACNLDLASRDRQDVEVVNSSLTDIEKILSCFKELVNINFGPVSVIDFLPVMDEFIASQRSLGHDFQVEKNFDSSELKITTEKTLLKMLFVNLVNNGLEANSDGFSLKLTEDKDFLEVCFVTADRVIDDPGKIFSLGYSAKGLDRGYGLYLCKKISDYLDLDLSVTNESNSVIFSVKLKKEDAGK